MTCVSDKIKVHFKRTLIINHLTPLFWFYQCQRCLSLIICFFKLRLTKYNLTSFIHHISFTMQDQFLQVVIVLDGLERQELSRVQGGLKHVSATPAREFLHEEQSLVLSLVNVVWNILP